MRHSATRDMASERLLEARKKAREATETAVAAINKSDK